MRLEICNMPIFNLLREQLRAHYFGLPPAPLSVWLLAATGDHGGSACHELPGHYPSDLLVLRGKALPLCVQGHRAALGVLRELPRRSERSDNHSGSILRDAYRV